MQVAAGSPDAKQCTVAVPRTRSLRCRAPSTLTLVARDAEGNTCTKGGSRVEVTAKAVGSVQPGTVVDNANGTYSLNLELDVEGDWEITAMVRDHQSFSTCPLRRRHIANEYGCFQVTIMFRVHGLVLFFSL